MSKPWSEMTDDEKRTHIREDQKRLVEWYLANKPLDQAAFYLLGMYDHDTNRVLCAISIAAQKGEDVPAEKVKAWDSMINSARKRAGLR